MHQAHGLPKPIISIISKPPTLNSTFNQNLANFRQATLLPPIATISLSLFNFLIGETLTRSIQLLSAGPGLLRRIELVGVVDTRLEEGDMKNNEHRKVAPEQASVRRTIRKSLTSGRTILKNSGGQNNKITERNEALSSSPRIFSEIGDCNSNKGTSPGTFNQMPAAVDREEQQRPPSAVKIKLQLFPLEESIRKGLEKDGHNPYLELILRPKKKISSVIKHLCSKWGSSSIAMGELVLFPFNIVVDNLSTSESWTSSDVRISVGDVHETIGRPDIFRLRYGWVSSHLYHSGSSPSLGCTEPGQLGMNSSSDLKNPAGPRVLTEMQNKDLEPYDVNEVTNVPIEQPASSEPHLAVHEQAEMKNDDYKSSNTSNIENNTADEEKTSADEDPTMLNDVSLTAFPLFDSNISIGGLFSEASLQGRFNKPGGGKLSSVLTDSLDAFFHQKTSPQASTALSPDMSLSILDAEDTCHSFAALKPSPSGKEFLPLGRRAFSELSNQGIAPRPFKCPKSEANAQDEATIKSAEEEQKTDPLPCSGVFNNENSLGLSNIKWNESLSAFDFPFTSRQILKDDSVSIGEIVR